MYIICSRDFVAAVAVAVFRTEPGSVRRGKEELEVQGHEGHKVRHDHQVRSIVITMPIILLNLHLQRESYLYDLSSLNKKKDREERQKKV